MTCREKWSHTLTIEFSSASHGAICKDSDAGQPSSSFPGFLPWWERLAQPWERCLLVLESRLCAWKINMIKWKQFQLLKCWQWFSSSFVKNQWRIYFKEKINKNEQRKWFEHNCAANGDRSKQLIFHQFWGGMYFNFAIILSSMRIGSLPLTWSHWIGQ